MTNPGAAGTVAAQRWAADLAGWRIPAEILAQAPQSPWIHPVELFRAGSDPVPDTPSRQRAAAALAGGGSVLDVGCGGGRAAFALTPPATQLIGVDQQQGMLDAFAAGARLRGVSHEEVLGDWPAVAAATPVADVVVCHHVLYNVAALPEFVAALTAHARRRVVVELPQQHPLSTMSPLWQRFWGLQRPTCPTADDALAVIREAGFDAGLTTWTDEPKTGLPQRLRVEFARIRLCLGPERDGEVAQALAELPDRPRPTATLWWDAG